MTMRITSGLAMRKAGWRLALLAVFWSARAAAGEADAAALAARLQPVQSLSAHFEQTVRDERGELLQQGSGQMQVRRPDQLRWQTREPFQYLVVTDGETLWRYDADLEQANREPFRGELADAPGLILGGDPDRIQQQYRISRDGEVFVLEPRTADALFQSLRLSWEGDELRRMTLVDRLDQTTEIEFSDVQLNPTLPETRFSFEPPPGTDVIVHD